MNNKILDYIKSLSENKKVQEILIKTIGNILLKQDNFNEIINENFDKIIHIRDWISSIVENNEEWKIPRVLTLEALNNSADKYFEKKNNKLRIIELDKNHEKLIDDLGEYYVVQMLTPEALDNESKQMQHCIGYGEYDKKLNDNDYLYLSLRDKYNNAHVTLEIWKNEIWQLQGKQNKIPEDRYLKIIFPWLLDNGYKDIPWKKIGKFYENREIIKFEDIKVEENIDYTVENYFSNCCIVNCLNEKALLYFRYKKIYIDNSYIISDKDKNINFQYINEESCKVKELFQYLVDKNYRNINYSRTEFVLNKIDSKIYSKYQLPDNCEIDNNLDFGYSKIKKLPNNLTVNGDLILVKKDIIKLQKKLIVNGDLNLSNKNIKELPKDIKVSGNLILNNSAIEKLPDNLIVNSLHLNNCVNMKELQKSIIINKNISLKNTKIKLPDNLIVKGNLELSFSKIEKLPKNLNVKGNLNLSYACIEEILDDTKIDGDLILSFSKVKRIPENIKCRSINIEDNQLFLIKESMDFKYIFLSCKLYTKQEFLEKFKYKLNISDCVNTDISYV